MHQQQIRRLLDYKVGEVDLKKKEYRLMLLQSFVLFESFEARLRAIDPLRAVSHCDSNRDAGSGLISSIRGAQVSVSPWLSVVVSKSPFNI